MLKRQLETLFVHGQDYTVVIVKVCHGSFYTDGSLLRLLKLNGLVVLRAILNTIDALFLQN